MTYPRLVWKNLLRHPLRTVFTTLSIALSIFLVCAVLTLPGALDAIIERSASNLRITVHHKAGLSYWLPYAYVHKLRSVPGVTAVNHYSWFGGVYDEPKNMFPNFAMDPETVGQVWAEYGFDPVALERFRKIRNAALVGEQTMRKFHFRIGQQVTLRSSVYPVDLTFQSVGVIPRPGSPLFWFNRQYLEEAMERFGRIDGLVANAQTFRSVMPLEEGTEKDMDIVLDTPGPGNNAAYGNCSLAVGHCAFWGGTGKFTWFHASIAVSYLGGPNWAWNGTFSYSPPD